MRKGEVLAERSEELLDVEVLFRDCARLDWEDLHVRYQAARAAVQTFLKDREVFYWFSGDEEQPLDDVDEFMRLDFSPGSYRYHSLVGSSDAVFFDNLHQQMCFIDQVFRLRKDVGYLDRDALSTNTLLYGAKAANLMELKSLVDRMNLGINCEVPPFECVGVDVENVDEAMAKFGVSPVIFRSSAVNSEDGEDSLAPGIYDSVFVSSAEDLEAGNKALLKVRDSLNAGRAVDYRRQEGLDTDTMGCVIQEFIDGDFGGSVNSIMAGRPELMEIVVERSKLTEGSHPRVVLKNEAIGLHNSYFCQTDGRYTDYADWPGFAEDIRVVEIYWGCPVQCEFVYKDGDFYLVQVRPLPKSFSVKIEVQFPEQEPLWEGAGVGQCDVSLPVLQADTNNNDATGAVVFADSWDGGKNGDAILRALPKQGVVVVLGASEQFRGHVETLCLARRIPVFFREGSASEFGGMSLFRESFRRRAFSHGFSGYSEVRCVCDGLKAVVYGIGEPVLQA